VTTRTIVFFHAHPDDEALISAGTIARAVDAGHRVVLVLATDGGAGTFDPTLLTSAETLADRRRHEARLSADALGLHRLAFLGYHDSGLESDPGADAESGWPAGSFCAAESDEATERLLAILREENADLLVADDSVGGYGHPDHLRVHLVATSAAAVLGLPFIEVTIDREFLSGGIDLAASLGLEVPDGFVPPDTSNWYTPHAELTHIVDVSSALDRKRASMAAHATQASSQSADSVRTLAVFIGLPDEIFAIAFASEWFVAHQPIPADLTELFVPVMQ
jgi:LmbE family N-acetylglucosaminyl deacetylase